MKARTSIAAVGATAIIGAGAFLLPAVASPSSATHTLTFTAVSGKEASFSKTTGGQQEKDVNSKGKIVGFDEIYFHGNSPRGGVTLDTSGGFLYGTLKFTNSAVTHGTVTGGTGKFKGVTGTIVGNNPKKNGTRTAVTITYHH
jgi:hypothetical protein